MPILDMILSRPLFERGADMVAGLREVSAFRFLQRGLRFRQLHRISARFGRFLAGVDLELVHDFPRGFEQPDKGKWRSRRSRSNRRSDARRALRRFRTMIDGLHAPAGVDQEVMHGPGGEQHRHGHSRVIERPSLRMISRAPRTTAASALAQMRRIAPSPARLRLRSTGQVPSIVVARMMPCFQRCASAAISCQTGSANPTAMSRACSAVSASRLRRQPIVALQRHDQLLADRIDGRIGDLREELLEISVEQPRLEREHRQRRIVAHRAGRLRGVLSRHRLEDHLHFLGGIAKRDLPLGEGEHIERLGRVGQSRPVRVR